ncbi:MAG: MptD family putative ECF transporter S component [Eggerthellaceae bacterium]
MVDSGMSAEYGQGRRLHPRPLALVALAATAVCPFVGGWIGSKLFKKHFAKISA